jgi:hypothetical protein
VFEIGRAEPQLRRRALGILRPPRERRARVRALELVQRVGERAEIRTRQRAARHEVEPRERREEQTVRAPAVRLPDREHAVHARAAEQRVSSGNERGSSPAFPHAQVEVHDFAAVRRRERGEIGAQVRGLGLPEVRVRLEIPVEHLRQPPDELLEQQRVLLGR